MKRLLSFILSLTLVVSLMAPCALGASDEAVQAANALHAMGLFNGTGKDANGKPIYDLDRKPTRQEAITMLVRLLGKEKEATSKTWKTIFTDVDAWASNYVGYAYAKGLTAGTSPTTFSGNTPVTASQYLSFVLRALGYSSGTDFQWDRAWELSDYIGLTDGRYNASTSNFTRGDVAIISNKALSTKMKDGEKTLREHNGFRPTTSPSKTAILDAKARWFNLKHSYNMGKGLNFYISSTVEVFARLASGEPYNSETVRRDVDDLRMGFSVIGDGLYLSVDSKKPNDPPLLQEIYSKYTQLSTACMAAVQINTEDLKNFISTYKETGSMGVFDDIIRLTKEIDDLFATT